MTSKTNLTLKEFWKEHLNILTCLKLIVKAWGKCLPGPCIQPERNCGLSLWLKETLRVFRMSLCLIWRILFLGKCFEVDDDVEELVEDDNTELTTTEL